MGKGWPSAEVRHRSGTGGEAGAGPLVGHRRGARKGQGQGRKRTDPSCVAAGVEINKVKDFWKVRTVVRLGKRKLPTYFGVASLRHPVLYIEWQLCAGGGWVGGWVGGGSSACRP